MKASLVLTDFSERAKRTAEFALVLAGEHGASNGYAGKREAAAELKEKQALAFKKLAALADHRKAKRAAEHEAMTIDTLIGDDSPVDCVQALVASHSIWMVVIVETVFSQKIRDKTFKKR